MRCPFCANDDTQVKDSRPTEDSTAIRRRRQCSSCGARFTTFERIQLREVTIVKSGDRTEPFDRSRLQHRGNLPDYPALRQAGARAQFRIGRMHQ